ncbi:MAG: ATP-binding protein [Cryomorphaceae bacterium]
MRNQPLFVSLLVSLAVFALTTTGSLWAWFRYQSDVEHEHRETINTLGEHTRSRIWGNINTDIDQLKNFANRLEFTHGDFMSYWQQDARQLVKLDSSIVFVEWIDSNMIIQDIVPFKLNRDAHQLDLKRVEYRAGPWLEAVKARRLNVTPWVDLVQGGRAFLMDSPVWIDSTFYGTITAGYDFTYDVDQFFEDNSDFHIHLHDQLETQFYCSDPGRCADIDIPEDFVFNGLININNDSRLWWRMKFYPTPDFFSEDARLNSTISLALSLFLGLTLSIALYFILKTYRQERATKAINERLESLNETLEIEKQRAEEGSRVKSEFLSNMSHEIRTPLNIIQGLIQLLAESKNESRQAEFVELLKNSTANLLGLLNNILDIDRIEAGLVTVQEERFQPVKKIEALCQIFQQGFNQKGVALKFETPENPKVWVRGDEVKFSQIISNFIQNALKFTDEGFVSIYYEHYAQREDEIEIMLRVTDTGIGIPNDRLAKIFERFSQLDSGVRKRYSGTGLGLSINYELVKLMGGDIIVKSEEGKGTEFLVTLIFKEDQATQAGVDQSGEVLRIDFTGKKCLIVEDNQLNVLVVSKMVESIGFKWDAVEDGEKGVNAFSAGKYDLIIMDLHMPVMDGMTASQLIMKMDRNVPILMLSANVTKEAIEQSKKIGIHYYLTKPVSKEKLVEVVNELIAE